MGVVMLPKLGHVLAFLMIWGNNCEVPGHLISTELEEMSFIFIIEYYYNVGCFLD